MFNRRVTFLILIFCGAILFSCTESEKAEDNEIEQELGKSEGFTPSDESIFNLESNWLNQDSEEVQLSFLSGKPTIMAMIYTHCQYSCPLIVKDMKEIYDAVPEDRKQGMNFLLVSIDPEQDRPDTLSSFMKEQKMNHRDWTMLVSSETNIRELAAVMGFRYKKSSLMDYAHSNLITVLNEKGEIVKQKDGFGTDRSELVNDLLELSN